MDRQRNGRERSGQKDRKKWSEKERNTQTYEGFEQAMDQAYTIESKEWLRKRIERSKKG